MNNNLNKYKLKIIKALIKKYRQNNYRTYRTSCTHKHLYKYKLITIKNISDLNNKIQHLLYIKKCTGKTLYNIKTDTDCPTKKSTIMN